jgi:hypothetical protein
MNEDDARDLNGLDAKIRISIRYFERILRERDEREKERNERLDERYRNQKEALGAALISAKEDMAELEGKIDDLKAFQSRLISIALATPVVTAIIVYLLTRSV